MGEQTRASARNGKRIVLWVIVGLAMLTIGGIYSLADRCPVSVGDATDFPLFVMFGDAQCGAAHLLGR